MDKLIEILRDRDNAVLTSGICSGRNSHDVPLWDSGENVAFHDGSVRKDRGYSVLAENHEEITEIAQAYVDGQLRAYLGSASLLNAYNGSSIVNIGVGYTSDDWILVPWGKFLLATNGVDPVQIWENNYGVSARNLGGVSFSWAKILYKFNPYIFAFNTSNGSNWMEWCSDDAVEVWTPEANNTAGSLELRDLDSEIKAVAALGQYIAVYSKESMGIVSPLNDAGTNGFIFGEVTALRGIGACSKRAVISAGRENFGFNRHGIWETDGGSFNYIDDLGMRDWINANVDFSREDKIRGAYNVDQGRLEWVVPYREDPNDFYKIGLAYKPNSGGYRSPTFISACPTALSEKSVFNYPIWGFGKKLAYGEFGVNLGDSSTPYPAYIQTKPLDAGNAEIRKRIQLIKLALQGNVTLTLYTMDDIDDVPVEVYSAQAEAVNNIPDFEAPYVVLRLSSAEVDADWKVSGIKILGQIVGDTV